MAAILGNSRMPPYLLIETFWKAEGKKIEEKSGTDSQNGTLTQRDADLPGVDEGAGPSTGTPVS
jgi:hypothetical protein